MATFYSEGIYCIAFSVKMGNSCLPPEKEGGRRARHFDLLITWQGIIEARALPTHYTDHRVRVYVSERDAITSSSCFTVKLYL
jgi:hypothetical protein